MRITSEELNLKSKEWERKRAGARAISWKPGLSASEKSVMDRDQRPSKRRKFDLLVGWGEESSSQAKTTGDGGGPDKVPERQDDSSNETPSPIGDSGDKENDDKALVPVLEEHLDNPESQDGARNPWCSPPARRDYSCQAITWR